MPLSLAGSIVAAPETVLDGYLAALEELRLLALDTLNSSRLNRSHRIYILQSALAFERERLWGRALERLNDGEFSGVCPACHADVYFIAGQEGFSCAAQDWVSNPETPRSEIHAVAADAEYHLKDAGFTTSVCYPEMQYLRNGFATCTAFRSAQIAPFASSGGSDCGS